MKKKTKLVVKAEALKGSYTGPLSDNVNTLLAKYAGEIEKSNKDIQQLAISVAQADAEVEEANKKTKGEDEEEPLEYVVV